MDDKGSVIRARREDWDDPGQIYLTHFDGGVYISKEIHPRDDENSEDGKAQGCDSEMACVGRALDYVTNFSLPSCNTAALQGCVCSLPCTRTDEGLRPSSRPPHSSPEMDYTTDYSQQQSQSAPHRGTWPPHLLTPSQQSQQQQQQQPIPFPSPVSPADAFFFPAQTPSQSGAPQTSPCPDSRHAPSGLTLNISGLSVASPRSLSPIGPHQAQPAQLHPHQLAHAHHHSHSHSHSSTSSISGPMTPVSPPSMSFHPLQPQFYFDDSLTSAGGLSPTPDPVLSQRRPSSSHSPSPSELAPAKSVPRKRSLTNALPISTSAGSAAHGTHQHSQSHSYSSSQSPHPIITTTESSPPLPTSSASSPSSNPHSHSRSLSHSHSHSSLSQSHSPQLEMSANPTSPYDDLDSAGPGFSGLGDEASDDDLCSPSGSFSASGEYTGQIPILVACPDPMYSR